MNLYPTTYDFLTIYKGRCNVHQQRNVERGREKRSSRVFERATAHHSQERLSIRATIICSGSTAIPRSPGSPFKTCAPKPKDFHAQRISTGWSARNCAYLLRQWPARGQVREPSGAARRRAGESTSSAWLAVCPRRARLFLSNSECLWIYLEASTELSIV